MRAAVEWQVTEKVGVGQISPSFHTVLQMLPTLLTSVHCPGGKEVRCKSQAWDLCGLCQPKPPAWWLVTVHLLSPCWVFNICSQPFGEARELPSITDDACAGGVYLPPSHSPWSFSPAERKVQRWGPKIKKGTRDKESPASLAENPQVI
jgi:hypothetical protein